MRMGGKRAVTLQVGSSDSDGKGHGHGMGNAVHTARLFEQKVGTRITSWTVAEDERSRERRAADGLRSDRRSMSSHLLLDCVLTADFRV